MLPAFAILNNAIITFAISDPLRSLFLLTFKLPSALRVMFEKVVA